MTPLVFIINVITVFACSFFAYQSFCDLYKNKFRFKGSGLAWPSLFLNLYVGGTAHFKLISHFTSPFLTW